jgi:hypothetical protein
LGCRSAIAALAVLLAAGCATPAGHGDGTGGAGGAAGARGGTGGGAEAGAPGEGGAAGQNAGGGRGGAGASGGSGGGPTGAGGGGRGGSGGAAGATGGAAGTGGGSGGGSGGAAGAPAGGTSGAAGAEPAAPAWSWVGVIGTGQSLSVGGHGNAPAMTIDGTTQPFHNLKLSLGKATVPPFDPTSTALSVVALVEPLRTITTTYPSPYPANIYGQSYHTAMSDEITALAMAGGAADYVTVHTEVGEAGQAISVLQKNAPQTSTTGRAYAASVFEASALARLAKAQGKTYGVGALVLTEGESDPGSATYEDDMVTLWSSYQQDLPGLTGQDATWTIPMLLSQQHSEPTTSGSIAVATVAQWKIGVDHPGSIICTGPKYQYAYVSDQTHLTNPDYERLGEKYAQVFVERVVRGHDWQPLQPIAASRSGRVITVSFHVPVPPLAWDTTLPQPHKASNTAWASGNGFEVLAGSTPVAISSVQIAGNDVQITCGTDLPATGVTVGYAMTADAAPRASGTYRWGLLHDSDPLVGYLSKLANPNYAVAFQLNVP